MLKKHKKRQHNKTKHNRTNKSKVIREARVGAYLLDDPVGGGEVQSDAAAFSADQDHSRPTYLAERDKGGIARLALHFPIVP